MSTAIYLVGNGSSQEMLFSFGDCTDLDVIYEDVLAGLESQGFTMVTNFMVTSSEHLDVDLLEMMEAVQQEVYRW